MINNYVTVSNSQSVFMHNVNRDLNFHPTRSMDVAGKTEQVKFDGEVESFVAGQTLVELPVKNVQQLRPFFEDTSGKIAEAEKTLDQGGVTKLEVDLRQETGHSWNLSKTENGNYLFSDPWLSGEKVMVKADGSVGALVVETPYVPGQPRIKQEIRAGYANGTIACLTEMVEVESSYVENF